MVPLLPDKKHPEFCYVYILEQDIDPSELSIRKQELTAVKLLSIKKVQSDRQKPNGSAIYAARNPRIYNSAFREINKRLDNKLGEL